MRTGCYPVLLVLILAMLGTGCAAFGRRMKTGSGLSPQSVDTGTETGKIRYLLYLPPGYGQSSQRWPLLLFLHGAGERGDDLEKVKIHGPPKLIEKEGKDFSFVIVSPQCPQDGWWSDEAQIEMLDNLLDHIINRHRIDQDRIYVTGLSMGGFGTWSLAVRYPHRFAAIAPICGGGDPGEAARISHLPVWIFHGARDNVIALERSQEMADALRSAGGDVRFTIYPTAGHDSWTETYDNPRLYEWLLQHRRSEDDQTGRR
jgi:predicted peptidase